MPVCFVYIEGFVHLSFFSIRFSCRNGKNVYHNGSKAVFNGLSVCRQTVRRYLHPVIQTGCKVVDKDLCEYYGITGSFGHRNSSAGGSAVNITINPAAIPIVARNPMLCIPL